MQRGERGESRPLFLGTASLLRGDERRSQDSLGELNSSREGEYDEEA